MRFYNVQALRFIAALGIVVFHSAIYAHNDRGGAIAAYFTRYLDYGVMLFFVISGFVVTAPALRSSVSDFLKQRFLRIFPPFWMVAIVASVGKLLLFGVNRFDFGSLFKALSLLPFGSIPYPVGIEWSLVYEVFFYAVLAVFAIFGRKSMQIALCAWIPLIVIANVIDPSITVPLPTIGQVALSAYCLPFALGVAARLAYDRGVRLSRGLGWLSAALLLVSCVLFDLSVPLRLAMLGAGFSMLVLEVVSSARQLSHKSIFVRGGDWSYGIYLVHVPVIQFCVRTHHFSRLSGDALFLLSMVGALFAGVVFGAGELALHRRLRSLVLPERPLPHLVESDISLRR